MLFDTVGNRVQTIVRGIPWQEGNPLSREIVATRQGRIYTYRGTEEPRHRARRHAIWVHDLATGENRPTSHTATGGFWNGQSGTRDGETIFLSTVNGELYRLATASGQVTPLGHFLPKAEVDAGARIDQLYGITLSADETTIYGVPRRHRSREFEPLCLRHRNAAPSRWPAGSSRRCTPAATCAIRGATSISAGSAATRPARARQASRS